MFSILVINNLTTYFHTKNPDHGLTHVIVDYNEERGRAGHTQVNEGALFYNTGEF